LSDILGDEDHLGLPGRDGLQVLTEVRERVEDIKVVILTVFDDRERVYEAICAGASGYLLKTADPDEILAGIRDVIKGAGVLSPPIASMILNGFAKLGPVNDIEPLTRREDAAYAARIISAWSSRYL